MATARKTISRFTANKHAQRFLNRSVEAFLFLMGIGSGDFMEYSGEDTVLDLLNREHHPPYCIFDVGANQGQYLNLILKKIPGSAYTVHCFEPSAYTFEILKKNSKHGERKNIVLNNFALGEKDEEKILYYNKPGSGLASLTKRRMQHSGVEMDNFESVRVRTLDDYCKINSIGHIHLLKCDVEGHELNVFSGASDMFGKGAIDIATFEFGGCNIDTRTFFQDFYYFFQNAGMDILRIAPPGRLYPVGSYKEVQEQFRCTNYIAVKNGG